MGLYDLFIAPFFFFAIWLWSRRFVAKNLENDSIKSSLFKRALLLRIIGSVAFALVYKFYYKGGDTEGYYTWANALRLFFLEDPAKALSFLLTNSKETLTYFIYSPVVQTSSAMPYLYLMKFGSSEITFIKIASIINVFGLFSYIGTSLCFAVFSFHASWKLYLLFLEKYPHLGRELSISILFIPSVVFWGSGLMKDTITFGALCFLTAALYDGIIKGRKIIKNVIYIAIFSYVIILLKGYIILAFVPAAAFWIFNEYKDKIKSPVLRFISIPVLLLFAVGLFFLIIQQIGDSLGKFSIDSIQKTATGYQQWHIVASENGSGYTLGNVGDFSASNIIKTIPLAINVTLFRPYLTEVRNVVLFIAAIESLLFFLFTIYLLLKARVYKMIIIILTNTDVQFCLFFSLTFAFSVGFTSYNFGALVRYKIPCLPYFAIALALMNDQLNNGRRSVATTNSIPSSTK